MEEEHRSLFCKERPKSRYYTIDLGSHYNLAVNEMAENGLITADTTFGDIGRYADSHVLLTDIPPDINEKIQ